MEQQLNCTASRMLRAPVYREFFTRFEPYIRTVFLKGLETRHLVFYKEKINDTRRGGLPVSFSCHDSWRVCSLKPLASAALTKSEM
jgi:hypothetical protein